MRTLLALFLLASAAWPQTEPTHIFIFAGQSNASGYGNYGQLNPVPAYAQTPESGWQGHPARSSDTLEQYEASWRTVPGLLFNAWNDQRQLDGYGCDPANPNGPYNDWGVGTIGRGPGYSGCAPAGYTVALDSAFGPEFSFIIKYRADHPNTPLAIIKQAQGGQGIKQWLPYDASTNPYGGGQWPDLQKMITEAAARLAAAGVSYVWDALVWSQGENNRGDPAYVASTRQFFANVRAITSPDLKVVMARMADSMLTDAITGGVGSDMYVKTVQIRADQEAVGSDPGNAWWSRDGEPVLQTPPADPSQWFHTTTDGYLADGERAYSAYKAMDATQVPGAARGSFSLTGGRMR